MTEKINVFSINGKGAYFTTDPVKAAHAWEHLKVDYDELPGAPHCKWFCGGKLVDEYGDPAKRVYMLTITYSIEVTAAELLEMELDNTLESASDYLKEGLQFHELDYDDFDEEVKVCISE